MPNALVTWVHATSVEHLHSSLTAATNEQPGKQRTSVARMAGRSRSRAIFPQKFLIPQILVPGDVSRPFVVAHDRPFGLRGVSNTGRLTVTAVALGIDDTLAEGKRAGIRGILQDPKEL